MQQDILDTRDRKHFEEMELLRSQLCETKETREREMAEHKTAESDKDERFDQMSAHSAVLLDTMREMRFDAEFEIDRLSEELAEVRSATVRKVDDLLMIVNDRESELSSVQTEVV